MMTTTENYLFNISSTAEQTFSSFVPQVQFSWTDYILFGVMLALSAFIGIYFGFFGKKQDTTDEYLLGGRTMKVFPVAMSLIASHISGITLLAAPADVYRFGAGYAYTLICILITCVVTAYVFLPVFYKLQLLSTYEYLKLRFDSKMRTFTSFLFALHIFLYLPVVIYIPALAFSQATGVHVHLITPIVCSICIFYTTIGGLKAVVWSDTLQFSCTCGAAATVFLLGLKASGGIGNVIETSWKGDRLDLFNFKPDLTIRDGFWALMIGQTVNWIALISVNQGCVQRFLAVSTISKAKSVLIIFAIGMIAVKFISVVTGLIMFTRYHDCDPLTTKVVKRPDQLLPYYVMDVAHHIPGLSGLFIAGVFSAALSTLSASLNTVAGTIYKDFIAPFLSEKTTEKRASNIIKSVVLISGIICTALVFVFEHLGGLLPLTISIAGVTSGPLLGLFILGMIFPMANAKGALWGSIASLVVVGGISFTTQYYKYTNVLKDVPRTLSTAGCNFAFNSTTIQQTLSNFTSSSSEPLAIFRISFYYYTVIGVLITLIVGLIVSRITRNPDDPPVDRDLLSPVIYFLLPKEKEYYLVEKAMEMVNSNANK